MIFELGEYKLRWSCKLTEGLPLIASTESRLLSKHEESFVQQDAVNTAKLVCAVISVGRAQDSMT
ncbi:hypothetical protein GN958_ATG20841 [Phytophthora infestans]|uniref:Uncharacterized protein n=1 Tax=Phytophthora infestans TaxID=4787 RepID=A0A8S9TTA0_PHYIN|nr:hypothetical protein GN958_ATG20841 [Phytophthora infestans]